MPRHKNRKEDASSRGRGRSLPASKATGRTGEWRSWRTRLGLLMVLLGLGAVLLVYRRDRPSYPNTIAEGAPDAPPEVAALLQQAGQVAGRLVETFPNSPDTMHAMAFAHLQFGKLREAVAYWEKCVELDPGFAPAYHSLGSVAQDGGEMAKAAEYFREAAKLDPNSSRHYARLGETLLNAGELDEAARVLRKDLEARPRSIPCLILIGQVYVRLKQYEKAREHLEKAVEMAPDYTSAYYGLGTACAKLGDREKAKEYLDRFKVLKARDEQAHRDELKKNRDVAGMRTAVAEVCSTAGKVYLSHGDAATAEQHLRGAIDCDPDLAEPRQVLAWLYQKQGRSDEALREAAALEEKAAESPAVCMSLGELYSQFRMFEKAEQAYRKLVDISPLQPGGYMALAGLYLQANRKIPEARALLRKAVELDPAAPHYSMLALACQRAGDRAGALAAIEEAVQRDPENPEYRRLRELLEKEHVDAALPAAP